MKKGSPKRMKKDFDQKATERSTLVQKGKKNLTTTVKCKIPKIFGIS